MPFQRRSSGTREDSLRLTGFFPTKRRGMWVGSTKPDQTKAIAALLKKAYDEGKGLAFFLWKQQGDGPEYAVTMAIDNREDRGNNGEGGASGSLGYRERTPRRRIEPDDNDTFVGNRASNREPADEFPFGNN